jgi:hypothetical protein
MHDLLAELAVACASQDLGAAASLLGVGADMLALIDRDAGVLAAEVGDGAGYSSHSATHAWQDCTAAAQGYRWHVQPVWCSVDPVMVPLSPISKVDSWMPWRHREAAQVELAAPFCLHR